jgi:hypothetical protein
MIRFKRSDMQLEVAADSSYLSVSKSRSRAGGYHYLTNKRPDRPIQPEYPLPMMNGPVHVHCSIMPMIVISAAEAEMAKTRYHCARLLRKWGIHRRQLQWIATTP